MNQKIKQIFFRNFPRIKSDMKGKKAPLKNFLLEFIDPAIEKSYRKSLLDYQKGCFAVLLILLTLFSSYVPFVNRSRDRIFSLVSFFNVGSVILLFPIVYKIVMARYQRFMEYLMCVLLIAVLGVITGNESNFPREFVFFQRGTNGQFLICLTVILRVRFKIVFFLIPCLQVLYTSYLRSRDAYIESYSYIPIMQSLLVIILIGDLVY
jgi:hypothetical protein